MSGLGAADQPCGISTIFCSWEKDSRVHKDNFRICGGGNPDIKSTIFSLEILGTVVDYKFELRGLTKLTKRHRMFWDEGKVSPRSSEGNQWGL